MRKTLVLTDGWHFRKGKCSLPLRRSVSDWEPVTIPHDWAVSGPFDGMYEPLSPSAPDKPGNNTGGLPYIGIGTYVYEFQPEEQDRGKVFRLEFDGVMSHSKVYVNGKQVGGRAYGYSSFSAEITSVLCFGKMNRIIVRAENPMYLSRWYPGAGIYREVRIQILEKEHFAWNGIRVLTKMLDIHRKIAILHIQAEGIASDRLHVEVRRKGKLIAEGGTELSLSHVELWSPEEPTLYQVTVETENDAVTLSYGFREVLFDADRGMFLNGKPYQFRGLCMHHDLGVFGAAYHPDAMRWRLKKIKNIGCNALRMSHNPPDPKLLDLCDELGFLVVDEAFDVWKTPKILGDYHLDYDAEHEKDLRDMIRRDRNHPSVVLWSIGNEIPEQTKEQGAVLSRELVDICHQEDPSRPVTNAINQQKNNNSPELQAFAETLDVIGFNYAPDLYPVLHKQFAGKPVFGLETSAVLCNRGEYVFPVQYGQTVHPKYSSAYATEYWPWSNSCEEMFEAQKKYPWLLGEFAWCTLDYLGEPFPYSWPNRSSSWGLFDLAGLPKDRAFLYAAQWHQTGTPEILHILPHWNWNPGEKIPVHVFTSCPEVELFLNGRSLGRRKREKSVRFVWENVFFEPGTLEAIGYDVQGKELLRSTRITAGKPAELRLRCEPEGKLVFVEVFLTDSKGNVCETADTELELEIRNSTLYGVDNGDVRSLLPFKRDWFRLYHGHAMIVMENSGMLRVWSGKLSAAWECGT